MLSRELVQPTRDYFLYLEKSQIPWPVPDSFGYNVLRARALVAEAAQEQLSGPLSNTLEDLVASKLLLDSEIKKILDRRFIKTFLAILENTEMYNNYAGAYLSEFFAAPIRRELHAYCLATNQVIVLSH